MRIVVLTQYFTPEVGATSARVHFFAAGLAACGHDVEVICEVPNHPQGVVLREFRGRAVSRRRMHGFSTAYVWVATRPDKGTLDRLAFYASYAAMAFAYGSLRPRPDVILASSPPLPVAAAAAMLARRHRCKWVIDVRDLWPAAAVALGELSDERALAFAERLERFLYRDAAAITAVTRPFVEHIELRADGTPIHLVPNGTTRFWLDVGDWTPDRAAAGLKDGCFTWTFAGNVGLAQGLDTAIDAAELLGDGYRLLILGDGAARRQLERRAAERAPGRVEFRDQVPHEQAALALRASDALLVSLSAAPELAAFVPSKLFDFAAVGRPVVLAAAGEPARLASAEQAAFVVPPGDADRLADAVRTLSRDGRLADDLVEGGRRFALRNLRERTIDALERVLTGV